MTVALRQATDHSHNTGRVSGRRETMRSTVKHLRYVLGSLSAVMFSAASAASV